MVDFNKIKWGQIIILLKILMTSKTLDLDVIEQRYNAESINFRETVDFLIELRLISTLKGKIILNHQTKKALSFDNDKLIKKFFSRELFADKRNRVRLFSDYFRNFTLVNNEFVFAPNLGERLKYSGIRNFLLDIGVLDFSSNNESYTLKRWITDYVMDLGRNISYNEFIKRNKLTNEIGNKAEIEILKLEKGRLKDYPEHQKKVERISLKDVSAGYDIKSFGIIQKGKLIEKYIEVKAVSTRDWHFFWTANELNRAKSLSERYFLYLLPVNYRGIFEVDKLFEIGNPYREVYQNQGRWKQGIELISFERNES